MSDKKNVLYNLLNYPFFFNTLRSILDGGQVKYIKKVLKKYNVESVFDVSCGCGAFNQITNGEYTGIDYNDKFIAFCKKKFGKNNKQFIVMDATQMDIQRKYDTSIIINSIHHFTDDEVIKILNCMKKSTNRLIIVHDMIPQKIFVSKFLYKIDRGNYIRSLELQKKLIQRAGLTIKDIFLHRTFPGLYMHSTIICTCAL